MSDHAKQTYYRLIALWAICEAMMGGIIHGFRLPVSGIVVGSCAVICICMIAFYVPEKGAILKATVIVAIFKMMLSPHSPPAAYAAVFFQGILGELLFLNRKYFRLSCLLVGILALFESAVQRIIIMSLIYGMDFWKAVDKVITEITKVPASYSLYIALAYVLLHLVVGFGVGWFAGSIPRKIETWKSEFRLSPDSKETPFSILSPSAGKRKIKLWLMIIWIALALLYIQSEFHFGRPLIPGHVSLNILIRSLLIVFTWSFLVSPLLLKILKRWLEKMQTQAQKSVSEILQLLPITQSVVAGSWKNASSEKGIRKIKVFLKTILANTLHG